jgi:hypothetical protein
VPLGKSEYPSGLTFNPKLLCQKLIISGYPGNYGVDPAVFEGSVVLQSLFKETGYPIMLSQDHIT